MITPLELKTLYPALDISGFRNTASQIIQRKDPRLVVIVGPCSIHDEKAALEYAARLSKLDTSRFFPVMRVFLEKPRTTLGWKGLLYDPHLDGSGNIAEGLILARKIMAKIARMGVPIATELLEPLALPYFEDLITWGLVGARTSASQPHRQIASGLSFPVGFKNDCQGRLSDAIAAVLSSRTAHTHLTINGQGKAIGTQTKGNPLTHLVLRGSDFGPNFSPEHIETALDALEQHRLEPRLLIDCSHGNCGKDHRKQRDVFESVVEQSYENKAIAGLMLESHLYPGKQPLGDDPELLHYGMSITDACIGWEETEELLKSISCVQK